MAKKVVRTKRKEKGRAATEDQLKKVNDTVNANKDQIDKNKQAR